MLANFLPFMFVISASVKISYYFTLPIVLVASLFQTCTLIFVKFFSSAATGECCLKFVIQMLLIMFILGNEFGSIKIWPVFGSYHCSEMAFTEGFTVCAKKIANDRACLYHILYNFIHVLSRIYKLFSRFFQISTALAKLKLSVCILSKETETVFK